MTNPARSLVTCDIFCHVIDNYGDIGVCWRLARALAQEAGWRMRLICDDLNAFARLCPGFSSLPFDQDGIQLFAWNQPPANSADVVIEAFACTLPKLTVQAMRQRPVPPLWINLEYLSAEDWVEGCHGLPSPDPHSGLNKIFIFPGFNRKTGGLIREAGLEQAREAWLHDPQKRSQLLRSWGVANPQALTVLLFHYPNRALHSWLQYWEHDPRPVNLLVPSSAVQAQLRQTALPITVQFTALPDLDQRRFDTLLWSCDWLFVRGEDSFVRAQWAGKPFMWQIYPQNDQAHEVKLQAFHHRYCVGMPPVARHAWETFSWTWNREQDVSQIWPTLLEQSSVLETHAQTWLELLNRQPTLQACLQRLWQDFSAKL
jgi:uncharacterized repeat protein (TIGR03837 family)